MNNQHLIREGHLLGFAMGLMLSRWVWVALLWGAFVVVLYLKSLFDEAKEEEDLDMFEVDPDELFYVMKDNERVAAKDPGELAVILEREGFDLSREFRSYDDPIHGVRIFTQERN